MLLSPQISLPAANADVVVSLTGLRKSDCVSESLQWNIC
jgi:hypothetical protein